ncbi:34054_t:CDS:2, partial [Racocetra persica]
MLLNQYSEQYSINLDICRISEDIYKYTNGNKGLVGACCKAIETEELRAYKSIVRVIKNLSSKQTDIISICNNEDGKIYQLLAEGIVVSKSNLAIQNIFAPQALNADNNLSEYAFQAKFSAILKYLLSNVYPVLQYGVIVEAKEHDINSNRRKRLDIFLCDHDLSTYNFKLV